MAIQYVGGQVGGRAGSTSTSVVTFSLSGGLASVPAAGDLVIITVVVGSQARNPSCAITTPTGYTTVGTQLNSAADTYDTSMQVCYKFMNGTPDTTFTLPSTGNIQDAQRWTVQVFRGVDPTTPFDVASVSATGIDTSRPDPGSITPTTSGAWVVINGGGAAAIGANYVAPTNFTTNFLTGFTADTNDALVGSGYWSGWSSGSVNPAAYTGGSTVNTSSWAARIHALRPAPAAARRIFLIN